MEDVEGDKDRKVGYASLALFHADASIALKPDYREAYFLKAQLLKKAGREDEAKKTFQYILEKLNPRDEEVT
ncbi:tetratricopeptide repeat protein [Candidatus Roizmanbacteria bacterium]|nr:tetratricopeptide repeat protein [Candidatus Roizmanbacteria bacterium]